MTAWAHLRITEPNECTTAPEKLTNIMEGYKRSERCCMDQGLYATAARTHHRDYTIRPPWAEP